MLEFRHAVLSNYVALNFFFKLPKADKRLNQCFLTGMGWENLSTERICILGGELRFLVKLFFVLFS